MTTFYAVLFTFIIGQVDPSVDAMAAHGNMNKFLHTVSVIESDHQRYAANPKSTSKSYFQFTDSAFITAKKRAERMSWVIEQDNVMAMSYAEQAALVLVDLYQREGTDKLLSLIADGNVWAMKQVYYRFHHTDPDEDTFNRAERIFNETYYGSGV